jgi:hypothetical protein
VDSSKAFKINQILGMLMSDHKIGD